MCRGKHQLDFRVQTNLAQHWIFSCPVSRTAHLVTLSAIERVSESVSDVLISVASEHRRALVETCDLSDNLSEG